MLEDSELAQQMYANGCINAKGSILLHWLKTRVSYSYTHIPSHSSFKWWGNVLSFSWDGCTGILIDLSEITRWDIKVWGQQF
jgi:hypothetical protein